MLAVRGLLLLGCKTKQKDECRPDLRLLSIRVRGMQILGFIFSSLSASPGHVHPHKGKTVEFPRSEGTGLLERGLLGRHEPLSLKCVVISSPGTAGLTATHPSGSCLEAGADADGFAIPWCNAQRPGVIAAAAHFLSPTTVEGGTGQACKPRFEPKLKQ